MRTSSIIYVAILAVVTFAALPAYAAPQVTLRTGMVDTINSIVLTDTSAEVFRDLGPNPVALYRIDFSITAVDDDVLVPLAATRGDSDAAGAEFIIESRDGGTIESGQALVLLVPHHPAAGVTSYTVKRNTTETFSLYVIFTDDPTIDREYRARMSGLTLVIPDKKSADLNQSEVGMLVSPYAELIETR